MNKTFSVIQYETTNLRFNYLQMEVTPPPVLPNIEKQLVSFIECPENLPIHQVDHTQCYWPREPNVEHLLKFETAPIGSKLKYEKDPVTGGVQDLREISLRNTGKTARNSMSMSRAPGPPCDGVRGYFNNNHKLNMNSIKIAKLEIN